MADVFPESMDRLDYQDLNESIHTLEDYIRYICERVDYTYGQLFKDIGGSGVLAVPIAIAVNELQKDVKALQNQMAGVSAEATSALNKVSALEDVVGDNNSGLVKLVNDIMVAIGSDEAGQESGILGDLKAINTAIGSAEAGHESGILGDIKEIKTAIGSDEAGQESGILGELKDHEQRITALENH